MMKYSLYWMNILRKQLSQAKEDLDKGLITAREFEILNDFALPLTEYGESVELDVNNGGNREHFEVKEC